MSSIQPFQFEPELTKKENPTNTHDQVKENTTNMPDQEEDRMEDEERVGKKYSVLEELLAKAKREPRESQERESVCCMQRHFLSAVIHGEYQDQTQLI